MALSPWIHSLALGSPKPKNPRAQVQYVFRTVDEGRTQSSMSKSPLNLALVRLSDGKHSIRSILSESAVESIVNDNVDDEKVICGVVVLHSYHLHVENGEFLLVVNDLKYVCGEEGVVRTKAVRNLCDEADIVATLKCLHGNQQHQQPLVSIAGLRPNAVGEVSQVLMGLEESELRQESEEINVTALRAIIGLFDEEEEEVEDDDYDDDDDDKLTLEDCIILPEDAEIIERLFRNLARNKEQREENGDVAASSCGEMALVNENQINPSQIAEQFSANQHPIDIVPVTSSGESEESPDILGPSPKPRIQMRTNKSVLGINMSVLPSSVAHPTSLIPANQKHGLAAKESSRATSPPSMESSSETPPLPSSKKRKEELPPPPPRLDPEDSDDDLDLWCLKYMEANRDNVMSDLFETLFSTNTKCT
ncbi:uncharacterized protein [Oscarella lobularis]|uniref:uncharacterized protein n=1 Tax=Oscarella lobularis TaxID=121494 RepID=UPI00331406AC